MKIKKTQKQIEKEGWNRAKIDLNEVSLYRKKGMTFAQIAKKFSVATVTIYRHMNPKKRRMHNERQIIRQRRQKENLIIYKGGMCCICGYDRIYWALDFHHLKTEDKSFDISSARSRSMKNLKKEADKTILICKNCHAELHAGLHPEYARN